MHRFLHKVGMTRKRRHRPFPDTSKATDKAKAALFWRPQDDKVLGHRPLPQKQRCSGAFSMTSLKVDALSKNLVYTVFSLVDIFFFIPLVLFRKTLLHRIFC